MENKNNTNIENLNVENPEQTKKIDKVTDDLFYESVKLIFDIGFDLADNLNLELIEDFLKKKNSNE